KDTKQDSTQLGARRSGWIREQKMHSQKDRNRNVRIIEKVNAVRGVVDETEDVSRKHRGHRHQRYAKEILPGKADQKEHQVHVRRIKLCVRDFPAPREVGRSCSKQNYRNDGERE